MTDRINAFIVILEQNISDDDAEATINAIRQIKGVLDVDRHVVSPADLIAEARVRADLGAKLLDIIYPRESS